MNSLQNFNYNGQIIQRRDDGFVSLTQMCSANGRRLDNWLRLKSTQSYLVTLSNSLTIEVVETKEGANGGTWGHSLVAGKLGQWLAKNAVPKQQVGRIYVYVDNGNNAYKIGFSVDFNSRSKAHKCSNPFLELVKIYHGQTINQEALVHEKLRQYRIRGTTEWYRKRLEVLKVLDLILENHEFNREYVGLLDEHFNSGGDRQMFLGE